MTDLSQEAERILDALYESTYRKGGDQIQRRERRCQVIVDALLRTRQEAFKETARIARASRVKIATCKDATEGWNCACEEVAAAILAQGRTT